MAKKLRIDRKQIRCGSAQYEILCARRQGFNNMVWQVPSLAIAAQSFLLAAVLGDEIRALNGFILSILSTCVGLAALQLMAKHRQFEVEDAELLFRYESENLGKEFGIIHGPLRGVPGVRRPVHNKLPSYKVWLFILGLFVAVAVFAVIQFGMMVIFGANN